MGPAADILAQEGFRRIGGLNYDLDLEVLWHPQARVQLITLGVGDALLMKGSKAYYLTSVEEEGETWARDIPALFDYLESHFPELHISFSFLRDVPALLAARAVRSRRPAPINVPGAHAGGLVRRGEDALQATERLRQLDGGGSDLLSAHLTTLAAQRRADLERLRQLEAAAKAQGELIQHLQREYREKGSAACLVFTISSNLHVAAAEAEVRDAARGILKELIDEHRYQVMQRLGGRLRIQAAESNEPVLAWVEQWCGGLLNPAQLERLRGGLGNLVEVLTTHAVVIPDADIVAEGRVVEHRKLLAPRVVSAMLKRLDRPGAEVPQGTGPLLRIGLQVQEERVTNAPCEVPLAGVDHTYISGKTRSGKTVAVRVICEEVALHKGIGVLLIDPRNQGAGILVPQDRPELLEVYGRFGMREPRGFPFAYHAPAIPAADRLPADLGALAEGRAIVSLKGLDDAERCRLFAQIFDAVFERLSRAEADSVRLVVAVEEAQLFTRRLVSPEAREDAERAETALNRALREGRKYGLIVVVSSQSIKDFSHDSAAIRQNASTRVFFHNSDREIEYARDFLDDPRALVRLRPGTAFLCNPAWGVKKAAFRPPFSKVWDFSEAETAALLRGRASKPVSPAAAQMLGTIRDHFGRTGSPPNMTDLAAATGITSKRRLQELVGELTTAGLAVTRRLAVQGQPRVVEPVDRGVASSDGTESGQNTDESRRNPGDEPHEAL